MSAIGGKADIAFCTAHVCFLTQSGHSGRPNAPYRRFVICSCLTRTGVILGLLGCYVRRRDFLKAIIGSAAARPLSAHAQQSERMRRIGVLLPATADDARFQTFVGAFLQELQSSGWSIGRNVRIDTRWATANAVAIRRHAAELVALAPDVILAHGASTVGPLLQVTRTVPIVFPVAGDPVGAGFVESLARPGGNATGFMSFEYRMGGKWLELLKQIAPSVTRIAVLRDAASRSGNAQLGAIQAMASSLRLEVTPVHMRDAGEIERSLVALRARRVAV